MLLYKIFLYLLRGMSVFLFLFTISKNEMFYKTNSSYVLHSLLSEVINEKKIKIDLIKQNIGPNEINRLAHILISVLGKDWYDQKAKLIIDYKQIGSRKIIIRAEFIGLGKKIIIENSSSLRQIVTIKDISEFTIYKCNFKKNLKLSLDKNLPKTLKNNILNFLQKIKYNCAKNNVFYCVYDQSYKIHLIAINESKNNSFMLFDDKIYSVQGVSSLSETVFFQLPLKGRIGSGFGWRLHPIIKVWKFHSGIDIAAPKGKKIYAVADGKIIWLRRRGKYGKCIEIKHEHGIQTLYGHLNDYASGLKKGSYIKKGQVIAFVGSTGLATGPHLHYEIKVNGKKTNPSNFSYQIKKTLTGAKLKEFKEKYSKIFACL